MRRRDFLRLAGASAGGLAIGCGAARSRSGRRGPDVVVVGGGLAGLVAARRLAQRGVESVVLEASDRPGGRVRTQRGFDDGLTAEAGAHDLFQSDAAVFSLLRELDLPLERWHEPEARTVVCWSGRRSVHDARAVADASPEGLSPEERRTFPEILDPLLEDAVGQLRRAGGPSAASVRSLDAESVEALLVRRGVTPAARAVVDRFLSVPAREASVLWAAWEIAAVEPRGSERPWRIVGGNDAFPGAIARGLGDAVRLGTKVVSIERDPLRVVARGPRSVETLTPRAVVVALPLPAYAALGGSGIDAPLREAAARIAQVAETVTHFQIRASEPLATSGTSTSFGDGAIAWTTPAAAPRPGRRAILEGWSERFGSDRLDAADDGDALATRELESLFPEVSGAVERVRRTSWRRVRGIGGAGAYFGPGQVALVEKLRAPQSPVFFAGDHASDRPTWTVGAVESGERAADEVVRFLRG